MKKLIKVIGILLISTFLLLPLKTNAQEAEWSQKLDLSDSVVSSVAKVEDGVVVMQYEGTASASNLLIKYDFNGNKIWEIDNDYGYYIESVSDGFIVWSETKITKFDKDKNIIWSNDVEYKGNTTGGLGNKLIELNDGYIIGQTRYWSDESRLGRDLFKFNLQGLLEKRVAMNSLIEETYGHNEDSYILTLGKSLDGKSLIMVGRDTWTGVDDLNLTVLFSDLTPQSTYKNSLIGYDDNYGGNNKYNDIIETEEGYILAGKRTITFNKEGKLKKIYSKTFLDITRIDDNIYGYVIEKSHNSDYNYKTSLIKYDQNLKELNRIELQFSFLYNSDVTGDHGATGFSQVQNRSVYYQNKGIVEAITLNTPINWIYRRNGYDQRAISSFVNSYSTTKYELVNYRFSNDETQSTDDNNSTVSDIINNIVKNPQTNSIIIIIVFVVLILSISIISYFVYQKKTKKKEIGK